MKVHLHQIPTHGLHLEGSASSEVLDLLDPAIRPVSEVRYVLNVGLSEGGLFATGQIETDFELECVACLTPFPYRLEIPDFAMQTELTGAELVDLTEAVREDILLALPPYPHCDWNGERTCPGVSFRAKTGSALAAPAVTDDAGETPKVWGALDQLNLKKTN